MKSKIKEFLKKTFKIGYVIGYKHPSAIFVNKGSYIYNPQNLYMYEGSHIFGGGTILNPKGKVIFKKNAGAAKGLTIVTANHMQIVGRFWNSISNDELANLDIKGQYDKDVIIEEDVLIGTNVTLLCGALIGRGASIGSGSVIRNKIPPYSIVAGNPAKVIGFKFTPEQIIEHEKQLYEEHERLPLAKLERNYTKYYLDKRDEIASFLSL